MSTSTGKVRERHRLATLTSVLPLCEIAKKLTTRSFTCYLTPPTHSLSPSPGRPPWYNEEGEQAMAFVIGLSGGSASGKTTVAGEVIQSLRVPWVSLLSMDSFYKVLTPEQHHRANENNYDFDVPGTWGDFMWGGGGGGI